jgi:hypothetical protein
LTSLLGRLLRLFPESVPLEDLFTEAVARLFEKRPDLCLAWLETNGLISPGVLEDGEGWYVHVASQRTFAALEHHSTDSRPDLVIEVHRRSEESLDGDTAADVVMIESKIGSKEGPDQLRRYAEHLDRLTDFGSKTLVYMTRGYDPKETGNIIANCSNDTSFEQLRWHDFYRFLQTVEKDSLIEELMTFMEEQGMAQSYRLSMADLLALSRVPRVFEILDETLGEDVRAGLEAFAGTKVKSQAHTLNQVRWNWRYTIIASLQDWDLFCFLGYTMDDPEEYPGLTVNLESRPNAVGRESSVAAMRRLSRQEGWEGYGLDSPSEWTGVCRWISLADLLQEEDHVAAVKGFFAESIRQLKEELTAFKKENPDLPWNGGA